MKLPPPPPVTPQPDAPRFLTRAQVARILGLHPDTISRLLREGVLAGTYLRRRWLVPMQSIERLADCA